LNIYNWIKSLQLDARILCCETPVNLGLLCVAFMLPGSDLAAQGINVGNSALQALPLEDRQFDFSDVQPAAMFRCVVPLDALSKASGLSRREALVQTGRMMDVQVVNHQNDLVGIRVNDVNQVAQHFCAVQLSAPLVHPGVPATGQRLNGQEKRTMTVTSILII